MLRTALVIISLAGGLAVSNHTVTTSGYAAAEISGYVVSDVRYDDGGNPGLVQEVRLRLDKAASKVDIRLGSTSAWISCSVATPIRQWRCPLETPVAVADIRRLEVAAADSSRG